MVPMLTCGFVRSNFALATGLSSWTSSLLVRRVSVATRRTTRQGRKVRTPGIHPGEPAVELRCSGLGLLPSRLRDDLLRDVRGNLCVGVEHHRVVGTTLGLGPQVTH